MAGLAGKTLNGYVLGQRIGKGGMADVYLAYHPHFQRAVAIKIFKHDNDGMLQRFMREAKIMASLHHPHLMRIYDMGESEVDGMTRYYIVMPFIDGGTLGTRIRHSVLSSEETSKYLLSIAAALDYLHKHGIIHRDIKSTNVLLSTDDLCYLSDLGVARVVNDVYTFTSTGNVMGTVDYIAPELFVSNNKADALSDIYSLGILLFEMVTGQRPFVAENQVALASMHVNAKPPLARTLVASISPAVEQVLLKALEKDPAHRFPTATAMAKAFEQATKMPHSFIPETRMSPEVFVVYAANGVALPDQPRAKHVVRAPISADFQECATLQDRSARQELAPVTPISGHTRSPIRILTPLLIVLLIAIAVPATWVLGQMHTTTTTIIRPLVSANTGIPFATATNTSASKTVVSPSMPQPKNTAPVTPTLGNNEVNNPGFETGSLANWSCNSGDQVVTSPVHTGSYALQITPTSSTMGECDQTVTVETNHTYRLSAYVDGSYAYIGVRNGASNWTSSGRYTKLSVTFTTSASQSSVTIYIHSWYSQGKVYVDDFLLS